MKIYTDFTLLINVPRTVSILTYYHALEVVTISVDLLNVRTVAPNSSSSVTSSNGLQLTHLPYASQVLEKVWGLKRETKF